MSAPAPLYQRVKDHILGQISSGEWRPGMRVPSENELVEHFRISRMTANRALKELTSDGWLDRIPGVGTFVREPAPRGSLLEIKNIAEEIRARGHAHRARVITGRFIKADAEMAGEFGMKTSRRLYHLIIVHEEDGAAVQLETRYVNPQVAPEIAEQDFTAGTTTAYLLAIAPVDELEHTVAAVMPSRDEARLLRVAAAEPCLSLHRRSWSKGRVVTVATLLYPASRYALRSRYHTTPLGTIEERRSP